MFLIVLIMSKHYQGFRSSVYKPGMKTKVQCLVSHSVLSEGRDEKEGPGYRRLRLLPVPRPQGLIAQNLEKKGLCPALHLKHGVRGLEEPCGHHRKLPGMDMDSSNV